MIRAKRLGLYYETIPMGGNQPVTGTEGMELPEYVYYVSPSFSGISPYFKTIVAANAACDGVHKTVIIVYPGTYLGDVVPKAEMFIVGIDKKSVRIQTQTTAAINASFSSGTVNFGIDNVTFVTPGLASSAIIINLSGTVVFNGYFTNIDMDISSLASGFLLTNTSGSNNHKVVLRHCDFQSVGTVLGVTKPFDNLVIDDCTFRNGIILIQFGNSGPFPSNKIVFQRCNFAGSITPVTQGIVGNYHFYGGKFSTAVAPGVSGEIMYFDGVQFSGQALNIQNTGTGSYIFQDCAMEGPAGSDADLILINKLGNFVKLYNCALTNGHIRFDVANLGFVAVDTVVKNPSGTRAISATGAVAPDVLLGNFSSDKDNDASVVVNAASYNVQLSKAI